MAKKYQGFKLTYNSLVTTFSSMTENVTRTSEEASSMVITPTGAKYKQVFGDGKYSWNFTYSFSERDAFDFFDDAYEATVSGYSLVLSEEQDDGSYTEYTVIMNRPQASPHTLGTSDNYDKGLSVEIFQA